MGTDWAQYQDREIAFAFEFLARASASAESRKRFAFDHPEWTGLRGCWYTYNFVTGLMSVVAMVR
jgi:hypothetical protein